ncbi:MAG: hypothetical protein U0441_03695 [Polyangiaceae bacterium]
MAQKRSSGAKNPRVARRDHEAAEGLTFLEKLVLRVLSTRQVPAESGVRFAISSKASGDGICLLFKVDDPDVPIVEDGPRPDYLAAHVTGEQCLFTIIEMKGTEQKNVEHGIEQIRAMYRRLRREMASCLPGSWRRARIQGLLLTPYNAHINHRKIEEARKEGVEILPLQYHHQAELYPYISKPVSRSARYAHEQLPRSAPELNAVEQLVTAGKLDRRVRDAHFDERRGAADDTFYLDFRRAGDPDAARVTLSATTKDAVLRFTEAAAESRAEVTAHLKQRSLSCSALRVVSA